MALQTLSGGGIIFPKFGQTDGTGDPYFSNDAGTGLIDAKSERVAIIFQAPAAGSITGAGFRTSTVTAGTTVILTLETVGTINGAPTGFLASTSAVVSQYIQSTDDNKWFDITFNGAHTAVKGEWLSLVVSNPATSSDAGNLYPFCNIVYALEGCLSTPYYAWGSSSGVYTLNRSLYPHCVAVNYGGTYYYIPALTPFNTVNSHSYNNTSSTDVYGAKFQVPFPATVTGYWLNGNITGDMNMNLYNSSGTILAQSALDANMRGAANTQHLQETFSTATGYASSVNLTANTWYRLGLEANSTTSSAIPSFDVSSSGLQDCFPGGQNFIFTSAKDPASSSSWTDLGTRRPLMGVILTAFDDAVSTGSTGTGIGRLAGGGIVH